MFNKVVPAIAIALILTFTVNGHTEERRCTQEEAIQAETEAGYLQDWDSVYRSFVRFKHCDDGAIGEGYSDSVGRLLAHHWSTLSKLNELATSDEDFERFVIKHVDETIPNVELTLIIANARTHCPAQSKRLCELIGRAASPVSGE
jgi:hypothetical protein